MGHAPAEQRIAACSLLVHVGVELITRNFRKALDVPNGDFALPGVECVADLKRTERLAERMDSGIELWGAFDPSARDGRNHAWRALHGSPLHVVQYTTNTTHLL